MKLVVMLAALITCSNFAFGYTHPKAGDKTSDVIAYTRAQAEFPQNGFSRFDCHDCSSFKASVFVTSISSCGTGSCDYLMFEKIGDETIFRSLVELKPGAFQILKTSHNGLPDIKSYDHMSADEGIVRILQFNGRTYKDAAPQKKVSSARFDMEITPEIVKVVDFK